MQNNIFHSKKVDINYIKCGPANGVPILFLHGGCSRWQSFNAVISDLKDKYQVYAMDLRGHGKSGRVKGAYVIEDYVHDVKDFIDNVIKDKTIIYGHSLGGQIAVMTAAYYPDSVKAIVVEDSPLLISKQTESEKQMLIKWRELSQSNSVHDVVESLKNDMWHFDDGDKLAREVIGENNSWFNFMAESLIQNDSDMITASLDDRQITLKNYNPSELFPKITCPVLLLHGEQSLGSLITDSDLKNAQSLIKKIKIVQIPGAGHALNLQNKKAVMDALITFLDVVKE